MPSGGCEATGNLRPAAPAAGGPHRRGEAPAGRLAPQGHPRPWGHPRGERKERAAGCNVGGAGATNPVSPPSRVSAPDARFAALLDAHGPALWRIAGAYAPTHLDREDLYQEMLLQAWRALPSFRGESTERTWLTRIAFNVALGAVRSRDRRITVDAPTAVDAVPDREPNPHAAADRSDALGRLLAAVRRLPEIDRALVVLSLEERTHAEIADVLGLSVSNVAVRLHRARQRLANALADPIPS